MMSRWTQWCPNCDSWFTVIVDVTINAKPLSNYQNYKLKISLSSKLEFRPKNMGYNNFE